MSRLLGIDATPTAVRTCLVSASYRKVTLEALGEARVAEHGSVAAAIRAAVAGAKADHVAVALSGERTFYRRIELPAAAQKELQNVLGFELEGSVPFDMAEAVFDHRVLRRGATSAPELLAIFAAIARTEEVMERIELVREATGQEPERVGTGALPLVNLAAVMPELDLPFRANAAAQADALAGGELPAGPRPIGTVPFAILDIEEDFSELVVVVGDEPVFARTLSRPAPIGPRGPELARALARELRTTLAAHRAQGGPPVAGLYVVGPGALFDRVEGFLGEQLALPVRQLPQPKLERVGPADLERLPRCAKALGLALSLTTKAKGLNLRQGELAAAQRYPFLTEKIPLLAGLGAVILVSFVFSMVTKNRAMDAEHEALLAQLAVASRDVLGEETEDPDRVRELLEQGPGAEEDPMPKADAFDVMVQLSKAVPEDLVHDVLELDVARGHVKIEGTVPTTKDAERVAEGMRDHPCFKGAEVKRTSTLGEGKQKYVLEFDVRCEPAKKKKGDAAAGATQTPAAGKPSTKGDKGGTK